MQGSLELLQNIVLGLNIHITTVCTFVEYNSQSIEHEIERYIGALEITLLNPIAQEEKLLLRSINKHVRVLRRLLHERESLENSIKGTSTKLLNIGLRSPK